MRTLFQTDMDAARRAAKKLELASPFNANRVALLRAEADEIKPRFRRAMEMQRKIGAVLLNNAANLDAATTLEQHFELLNTNVADRADVPAGTGLTHLVLVYCVEDSAAHRGEDWHDAPMGNAARWAVFHKMATTPEGKVAMDEMWEKEAAPGGLFEGMFATYHRQPDGNMRRAPPRLTVVGATPSTTEQRSEQ
ncbi:hypothetical protein [Janthinobacterium fluminis]|uniref:Uncharacterized protein n=1 Tax=Janthinobacterium fluminis TaxID=2987524 RepID=A0ABT5K2U0_9BURK|nr:hypothetical protein [Janthinobacterium fluminis]MDC8759051.1 hypothetical protein [Janthinobacterium fluminis]